MIQVLFQRCAELFRRQPSWERAVDDAGREMAQALYHQAMCHWEPAAISWLSAALAYGYARKHAPLSHLQTIRDAEEHCIRQWTAAGDRWADDVFHAGQTGSTQ